MVKAKCRRAEKEDVHKGERDQSAKERRKKKKREDEQVDCSVACASQKGTAREEKGGPPSVCERGGPSAPMREKEQSAGKEKKSKNTNLARAPCVRIQEKGDPLMFASERGPLCTCEKRGTVRRKEKKKTPSPFDVRCFGLWWGEKSRRSGRVTSK